MTETLIDIYNRTYSNCVFYLDSNRRYELINEIGCLRGIVYAIEAIVGTANLYKLINCAEFHDMIDRCVELLKGGDTN